MSLKISDIPILQRSNVKMKDPKSVIDKINQIVAGKANKLQMISDYDFTLTKHHINGEPSFSSFGLITIWNELPPGFVERDQIIKSKYHAIEIDMQMTTEEKIPHMEEWYKIVEKNWKGQSFTEEALRKLIAEKKPQLRDGTIELYKELEKKHIPLLVLSAGLGDVIREVLNYHGITENDYMHVVSNFFKVKDGIITGYSCKENGSYIHPYNKNVLGCMEYFKKISLNRKNVIIMGDSLGDADMARGVPHVNCVLKIGFLYATPETMKKNLPKYLDMFDIVLLDDQTMDVVKTVIDLVLP